ncbi:hypothetical protein PNOK_0922300 [Pyrrhoderma noxium]|uniref:Uncharacterized protein n=1 Tax=Pyrrhoderma noxium TaxID=2282107 RepID=A0A286U7F2_9AGAM|nr:hypothetical protein PNOK_0922300 [Pyrrhoderma noxium]
MPLFGHKHHDNSISTSNNPAGVGTRKVLLILAKLMDTGVGTGPRAAQQALPPRTDASGNPAVPRSRGTLGSRMTGKAEFALGSVVGSQSLKEKGLAKEREADALKAQAAELSEAERLEREAISRRERAVAHGAHPELRHLGGHNPSI